MSEWDKFWERYEFSNTFDSTGMDGFLREIKAEGDKLKEKADKWDAFKNDVTSGEFKLVVIPSPMYDEFMTIADNFETELDKRSNIGTLSEDEQIMAEVGLMRKLQEWSVNYNARSRIVLSMRRQLDGVQAWIDHVNTWSQLEHGIPGLVWELEESMKAGKLVKEHE
jgi:hypothetical protein